MRALLDHNNQLHLWVSSNNRELLDHHGKQVGIIFGQGIYNAAGHHVAIWNRNAVRDHDGHLLLSSLLQFKRVLPRPPRPIYFENELFPAEKGWASALPLTQGLRLIARSD